MCHAFVADSRFYQLLFRIDQDIAVEVQCGGCGFCGGVLHSACYPRKPRGIRSALDETYDYRLSFCCATEGCRRRTTPPSVRFLGRKVYLGVIVVLVSALAHGLSGRRRRQLIDALDVSPQTLWRWQVWWRAVFAEGPWWRIERAQFVPPIPASALPGALLGRLHGADLRERVVRLLWLIAPLSTTSWSGSLRVAPNPQNL
jgi:hypothetical protein